MVNIITIDGPGSSGKSSVGQLFAKKINYQFIDTGAIYRIFGAYVLNNNLSLDNEEELISVLKNIKIEFKEEVQATQVYADGVNITDKLHHPSITTITPQVAAIKKVRQVANIIQRHLGEIANTVMTGRDIGTEIFPDAKLKFYITAKAEVRAHRRYLQLKQAGAAANEEEILEQIKKRDQADSQRAVSPLRKPADAIEIDTSDLTLEESVEKMLGYFKKQSLSSPGMTGNPE
jgi:CMP/dCMP kinase